MDLSLWGSSGTMFHDPSVHNIAPADIARYVAPGWEMVSGQPQMRVPPPPGWSVEFGYYNQSDNDPVVTGPAHLIEDRGNGLFNLYYPDGTYWMTSSSSGGSGLLHDFTIAMIGGGVVGALSEVVSVASAGGLASQAATAPITGPEITAPPTGSTNMSTYDTTDYWDGDLTNDWVQDVTGMAPTDSPFPNLYDTPPTAPAYDIPSVPGYDTPFPDLYTTAPVAPSYPIPDVHIMGGAAGAITDITGAISAIAPAVLAVAQVVRAFNGQVQPSTLQTIANAANGTVNGVRPPVGTLAMTPDGGAIINNGDGTYTVIRPDGSRITRPYATGATTGTGVVPTHPGGVSNQTIMLGAAGLVALYLVTQPRGAGHRS